MNMTQTQWDLLSPVERIKSQDLSDLTPQLVGLEHCRVKVVDMDGEVRRFNVGRSTGWCPIHLELHNSRSRGGDPAAKQYQSVTIIKRG